MKIKQRRYWKDLIEASWNKRSILWLSGVRRVGKTCLCQTMPEIEYFDCELPRHRREMDDPEIFLERYKNKRIVLDEIHRLQNPAELLKIASDHYPGTKVLATGSSTLGASSRFKDTLTGRKLEIWLTPMISFDLKDFRAEDLSHRLHRGGLPPFLLDNKYPDRLYQEWMDSFWAKDIQDLFRLEKRFSFLKFTELLFMQSGGIFEATKFSIPCEISRTTVNNYLAVLDATFVAHIIRPFSSRRSSEILSAPKVYAFDTGFVSFYRGWQKLRPEDMGILWEHYVLNEIFGRLQRRDIYYWRDKRHHEVDLIIPKKNKAHVAIECKISADVFDPTGMKAFRRIYPEGKNFVVSRDVTRSFSRRYDKMLVEFVGLDQLISHLE